MRVICTVMLCAVAGCTSRGSEAAERAERTADTTGRRDSIAAVSAATMREEHVIGLLEQTHAADSALGALGAARGSTSEVKDFGRMILREHHALRRDAVALSRDLGVAPAPPRVPPDEPPVQLRRHLESGANGPIWDQSYLEYAIALHESALENSARALAATKNPPTKEFIQKSVPILQKHLDKANVLRKALGESSDAAPATKP
jgi:putative membrane protein